MERLSFQVAEYDAPLDLILSLIAKHELDIMDIDISSLLEQYMETIQHWKQQDLEVASEFLQMASRLVYMKTVSLLPRHKEESDKLRQDFSGELMEYQICKLAAKTLDSTNYYEDLFVRSPMDIDIDPTYKLTHEPYLLFEALKAAIGRGERRQPPPKEAFEPLVSRPVVSVTSKIFTVLRTLRVQDNMPLQALFSPDTGRSGLVATFLAVLELMKSGKVWLTPEETLQLRSTSKSQEPWDSAEENVSLQYS